MEAVICTLLGVIIVYVVFLTYDLSKLSKRLKATDNKVDENDEFVIRVAEKFTEYDRFMKDQATENNATYDRVKSHYLELSEQLKIDNKSITNIIQAVERLNKKKQLSDAVKDSEKHSTIKVYTPKKTNKVLGGSESIVIRKVNKSIKSKNK